MIRALTGLTLLLLLAFPLTGQAQVPPGLVAGVGGGGDEAAAALPEIPENMSPEEALRFIAGLSDPEARLLLLEELRARAESETAPQGRSGLAVVAAEARLAIQTHARKLARAGREAYDGLFQVPSDVTRILGSVGEKSYGFLGVLGIAIATIFVAFSARGAVQGVTANARAALETGDDGGVFSKLLHLVLRAALDLLGLVVFAIVGFAIGPILLSDDGAARSFVSSYVFATLVVLTVATVSRMVLAPHASSLRLFPIGDDAAQLAHRCLLILVGVSTYAWLTSAYILIYGKPEIGVHQAIVLLTGLIVFATVLRLVWMVRDPVRHALLPAEGPSSTVGKIYGVLARNWHWVMTVYVVLVALIWADGHLIAQKSAIWQAIGSVALLLLVPVIDRFLARANRQFVEALVVRPPPPVLVGGGEEGGPASAGAPTQDDPERYISVIQRGLRVVLVLVASVTIFGLWGFDLLKAIGAPGVAELNQALFDVAIVVVLAYLLWALAEAALTGKHRRRVARNVDWEDGPEEADHLDAPTAQGSEEHPDDALPQARAMTLLPLIRRFILIVLTVMVVMISLSSLGVDIGPLLAGAGVVGLAIGFGAQTLVRDVVSGVFFLVDDAFRVGEYIEMGELRGEVEAISIRSLRLRHHRGAIHTVPFGELRYITNYNRDWVIYKMNFRVAPETDPQQIKKIVKTIGAEMMADELLGPKLIEPLKSQGVFAIDDDSALIFRVKFMCKPREQFVLRREAYHRIQKAFAAAGIELARRKVEVVVPPEAGREEIAEAAAAATDDALKAQQGGGVNTEAR